MKEIYVSIDVETDGPIPGRNSMLSLGAAKFTPSGLLLTTFSANLEPLAEATPNPDTMAWWKTQPEAWASATKGAQPAPRVMMQFAHWVQRDGGKATAVAYPATFDFMFVYWYLIAFYGSSPFGFQALDLKTLAAAKLNLPFREATKRRFPKAWFGPSKHTHVAVDDAIEQGEMFFRMKAHSDGEKSLDGSGQRWRRRKVTATTYEKPNKSARSRPRRGADAMTRTEHLMVIAMEECAEVSQRVSKALRFGLDQVQAEAGHGVTGHEDESLPNGDRIRKEYSDLAAVLEMLGIGAPLGKWMDEKRDKVEHFLRYSAERGTLEAASRDHPTPEEQTLTARLHILLAEALRCLDDGRLDAVRRKVAYADVLICELESASRDRCTPEGNEGYALRRLSDALTGSNASTWDEVFHAAESRSTPEAQD